MCTLSSQSGQHRNHEEKGHVTMVLVWEEETTCHCEILCYIKVSHEMQMYKRCPNHCHFGRIPEYQEMSCPGIPGIIRASDYPCNSHQCVILRITKVLIAVIN